MQLAIRMFEIVRSCGCLETQPQSSEARWPFNQPSVSAFAWPFWENSPLQKKVNRAYPPRNHGEKKMEETCFFFCICELAWSGRRHNPQSDPRLRRAAQSCGGLRGAMRKRCLALPKPRGEFRKAVQLKLGNPPRRGDEHCN